MTSVKKQKEPWVFNQYLKNKYWFLGSVLLFLGVAFIYLQTAPPKFEVSSKIEVDKTSGLIVDSLRSTNLIQRVLDRLPFRVDYYTHGPKNLVAIHRDSLPVKLIVAKNAALQPDTKLELTVVSKQQFEIAQEDTISSFRFNEAIKQPYGRFTVVKGPAFSIGGVPVVLELKGQGQLLEEYKENFTVKTNDDNTVLLSIVADQPQKGIDFLNKIVEVYSAGHTSLTYPKVNAAPVTDDGRVKMQGEITALKARAEKLDGEVTATSSSTTIKTKTAHRTKKPISDPQVRTLLAMIPYIKTSTDQFVQVPYTDDIKDDDLRDMIKSFNKTQLDKQRLLTDSAANNSRILSFNRQLASLKGDILENINLQTTEEDDSDPMEAHKNTAESSNTVTTYTTTTTTVNANKEKNNDYKDSLAATNKKLETKLKEYALLLKSKPVVAEDVPAPAPITGSAIRIIEKAGVSIKPVHPGATIPYLLAILAGLLAAALFIYVKHLITSYSWTNPVDFKKLNEKLASLIGRSQIE